MITNEQAMQMSPKTTLTIPAVKNDTESDSIATTTRRMVRWLLNNAATFSHAVSTLSLLFSIVLARGRLIRRYRALSQLNGSLSDADCRRERRTWQSHR